MKMNRLGKSETSKCKRRIQALVREIVIKRDGGCVYRNRRDLPPCNGYRNDGELVLQADHLVSRGKNVGFADTRLIVCVCKGHHTAKTFDVSNRYRPIIRELIGKERTELWEKAEADRKSYAMGIYEWSNTELALKQELKTLT